MVISISATPGAPTADARPPIVSREPAPSPGVAGPPPYRLLRPTVVPRPLVTPVLFQDARAVLGYELDHPYVRRFWTAVIGPGAVADLLRLTVAARRGRSLPRPLHLGSLIAEDLVRRTAEVLAVRNTVPPLSVAHVRRLSPSLRREHAACRLAGRSDAGSLTGAWTPMSNTPSSC